jgi:hypothetical protein
MFLKGKLNSDEIKEKLKTVEYQEQEQKATQEKIEAFFENFRTGLLTFWIMTNCGLIYFILDVESIPFAVKTYTTILFTLAMLSVGFRTFGSLLYLFLERRGQL